MSSPEAMRPYEMLPTPTDLEIVRITLVVDVLEPCRAFSGYALPLEGLQGTRLNRNWMLGFGGWGLRCRV